VLEYGRKRCSGYRREIEALPEFEQARKGGTESATVLADVTLLLEPRQLAVWCRAPGAKGHQPYPFKRSRLIFIK